MQFADQQQAAALLRDPSTPADALGQIATAHRELWPAVARHPNAYPELIEWMRQQGFVVAESAVQSVPQSPPQVQSWAVPGAQFAQQAQPMQPEPRKKRTGLIAVIAAVAAVAVAAAIAIPMLLSGGGGNASARELLSRFPMSKDFSLSVIDLGRLGASIEAPLPKDGSPDEVNAWLKQVEAKGDLVVKHLVPEDRDSLLLRLFITGGGYARLYTDDELRLTLISRLSDETLHGILGEPERGAWEQEDFSVTSVGGLVFLSGLGGEDTTRLPETAQSMAAEPSVLRTAERLQRSNAYLYQVMGAEAVAETGAEQNLRKVDGQAGTLEAGGFGVILRNGDEPAAVLVWDFGTPEAAAANLGRVRTALQATADDVDQAAPNFVETEGSLIVADISLRGNFMSDVYKLYGLTGKRSR